MKLSRLVLPLVCLCTLTGCVSVSNEDFLTTAKNIEEHKFKYVTFNYYAETDTEKGEGTVVFTKRDSDGRFNENFEKNCIAYKWYKVDFLREKIWKLYYPADFK